MKIKKGFAMRNIAGSNVVVPVGKRSLEFNGMVTLNDSGAFFWKCFESDRSIDEVVKLVTEEYEIDEETARADIESFVEKLRQADIIE